MQLSNFRVHFGGIEVHRRGVFFILLTLLCISDITCRILSTCWNHKVADFVCVGKWLKKEVKLVVV